MNYRLHENGWTVIVENFDLYNATDEEILLTARLLMNNLVVVFKGLNLSPEQELAIINRFPKAQSVFEPGTKEYIHWAVSGGDGILLEVTGKKNQDGEVGYAGDEEMPWHCNDTMNADRRRLVWLYGVSGTKGSKTSWNNTILAYEGLDTDIKEKIEGKNIIVSNGMDEFQVTKDGYDDEFEISDTFFPPLVQLNAANKKGLFWPGCQAYGIKEMESEESKALAAFLMDHVVKEKYLYHHYWDDGDLVISDQVLSIHKRWHFDGIENRFVHRGIFDYPEQDYTKGL
jgi:taurine dioxygenase